MEVGRGRARMTTTNEDLMRAIGGLEATVLGCRTDIAELKEESHLRFNGHAARLRSVEDSRSTGKGIMVTLGVVVGAIGLERLAAYLVGWSA